MSKLCVLWAWLRRSDRNFPPSSPFPSQLSGNNAESFTWLELQSLPEPVTTSLEERGKERRDDRVITAMTKEMTLY